MYVNNKPTLVDAQLPAPACQSAADSAGVATVVLPVAAVVVAVVVFDDDAGPPM